MKLSWLLLACLACKVSSQAIPGVVEFPLTDVDIQLAKTATTPAISVTDRQNQTCLLTKRYVPANGSGCTWRISRRCSTTKNAVYESGCLVDEKGVHIKDCKEITQIVPTFHSLKICNSTATPVCPIPCPTCPVHCTNTQSVVREISHVVKTQVDTRTSCLPGEEEVCSGPILREEKEVVEEVTSQYKKTGEICAPTNCNVDASEGNQKCAQNYETVQVVLRTKFCIVCEPTMEENVQSDEYCEDISTKECEGDPLSKPWKKFCKGKKEETKNNLNLSANGGEPIFNESYPESNTIFEKLLANFMNPINFLIQRILNNNTPRVSNSNNDNIPGNASDLFIPPVLNIRNDSQTQKHTSIEVSSIISKNISRPTVRMRAQNTKEYIKTNTTTARTQETSHTSTSVKQALVISYNSSLDISTDNFTKISTTFLPKSRIPQPHPTTTNTIGATISKVALKDTLVTSSLVTVKAPFENYTSETTPTVTPTSFLTSVNEPLVINSGEHISTLLTTIPLETTTPLSFLTTTLTTTSTGIITTETMMPLFPISSTKAPLIKPLAKEKYSSIFTTSLIINSSPPTIQKTTITTTPIGSKISTTSLTVTTLKHSSRTPVLKRNIASTTSASATTSTKTTTATFLTTKNTKNTQTATIQALTGEFSIISTISSSLTTIPKDTSPPPPPLPTKNITKIEGVTRTSPISETTPQTTTIITLTKTAISSSRDPSTTLSSTSFLTSVSTAAAATTKTTAKTSSSSTVPIAPTGSTKTLVIKSVQSSLETSTEKINEENLSHKILISLKRCFEDSTDPSCDFSQQVHSSSTQSHTTQRTTDTETTPMTTTQSLEKKAKVIQAELKAAFLGIIN